MFGDDLVRAFGQFKAIFDPDNLMNPGKVVAPYRIDENLRLGASWTPRDYDSYFSYPDDDGRFERAVMRCVGVGKCRHRGRGGGVMCPSYMVTREEEHSTRGRSRLLFEMLEGHADSPVTAGWRSTEVRDALDLCLACKGCKKDCPVEVDMATMKAEFLAHHYAGRLRPRAHYSMGWLPAAAQVASRAPAAGQRAHPGPRPARRAHRGGRHRPAPPDPAVRPARRCRPGRPAATPGRLGCAVRSCCGRTPSPITWPLDRAGGRRGAGSGRLAGHRAQPAAVLRPDLDLHRPAGHRPAGAAAHRARPGAASAAGHEDRRAGTELHGGVPVRRPRTGCPATATSSDSGTRPSPWPNCCRHHTDGWQPPRVGGQAIAQTHCHQHAIMGYSADRALLDAAGVDLDVLDAGCCGLAGNFGFEAGHYDVSMARGERVLLPAVRDAPADSLVLADGFSCRTQIEQSGAGRTPVHLAELLAAGLRGQPARPGPSDPVPPNTPAWPVSPPARASSCRAFGPAAACR